MKEFRVTAQIKEKVRKKIEDLDDDLTFEDDPLLASFIACLGLQAEVGTQNDELQPSIFDPKTKKTVKQESLRSRMVTHQGRFGITIYSDQNHYIDISHPYIKQLAHPALGGESNKLYSSVTFFPQTIAEIISLEGVKLTVVKQWALNSIFGGFENTGKIYVTNNWELEQNDGLRMANLILSDRLAFLGTHDLAAHIAGVDRHSWSKLKQTAEYARHGLKTPAQKAINHLVVPYLIGVLLDDLAQPVHYDCHKRKKAITKLNQVQSWILKAAYPKKDIVVFPTSFEKIIEHVRNEQFSQSMLTQLVKNLGLEIQSLSTNTQSKWAIN